MDFFFDLPMVFFSNRRVSFWVNDFAFTVLYTDLMCDFIYGINSFKKFVVFLELLSHEARKLARYQGFTVYPVL